MRLSSCALILLLATSLVACGGGGGGSDTPPAPSQPGTLRTIALQGEAAPDGAGVFLSFPVTTPMSAASGSWGAFVGATSVAGEVAYVVEPDGSLVPVFTDGDAAPDLASGVIDGIHQVWVGADGRLVAHVGVSGGPGGTSEGLVSAKVDSGVVSDVTGLVYEGEDSGSGAFTALDASYSFLRSSTFLFRAEVSGGTGFWRIGVDGSGLLKLVASGDGVPNGKTVLDVWAAGASATGTQFAFVAETTGTLDRDGIYVGDAGSALFGEVAVTGDPLAAPDTIALIPYDQPLVVYGGAEATVLYKCTSNFGEDHLILGVPDQPDYLIAREGDDFTSGSSVVLGPLDWLHNGPDAALPMFQAGLSGAGGITFGIISLNSLNFATSQVTLGVRAYDGQRAPTTSQQAFSSTFPGLGAPRRVDVSPRGDLAFANVLTPSGSAGLFWGVTSSQTIFATAVSGQSIPGGGDTFGGEASYRSTTANGVVLFRAPVMGAGSGIFRRGR